MGLLLAVVIALSLTQAALVFACSANGAEHGQGNGNPGGQCFGATHGLTFGFSNDPKSCGGSGPMSGPPAR